MPLAFVEFEWTITPTAALTALTDAYIEQLRTAIRQLADYYAPLITEWMKANAPWTDRTGDARRLLHTEVENLTADMVQISLNHGVEYAVFLEVANAGAYSIIGPALDYWGAQIWADVQRMLR